MFQRSHLSDHQCVDIQRKCVDRRQVSRVKRLRSVGPRRDINRYANTFDPHFRCVYATCGCVSASFGRVCVCHNGTCCRAQRSSALRGSYIDASHPNRSHRPCTESDRVALMRSRFVVILRIADDWVAQRGARLALCS